LLDVANIVKTKLVSADAHTEGLEQKKDQASEQPVMDVFASAVVPDVEASLGKVISCHNTGVGDIVSIPCRSEGVSRGAVCGLLMERLQDVSAYFVCFASLFIDNCVYNFYVRLIQALSLTKVAEKIITEENSDSLWRRIIELEEKNSQVKASAAELQKIVDSSIEAVTSLRRALEARIKDYELLKDGKNSLYAMLCGIRLLTSSQS
jgi:hypothetical protein